MTFDAPFVLWLAPLVGATIWLAAVWARRVRVRRAARWSHETALRARAAVNGTDRSRSTTAAPAARADAALPSVEPEST